MTDIERISNPQTLCPDHYKYSNLTFRFTNLGLPIENGGLVDFHKKEVFCGDVLIYSEMVPTSNVLREFCLSADTIEFCRNLNQWNFRKL